MTEKPVSLASLDRADEVHSAAVDVARLFDKHALDKACPGRSRRTFRDDITHLNVISRSELFFTTPSEESLATQYL